LKSGPARACSPRHLLAHAKRVIAVEADRALASALREKFAQEIARGRLELIEGDIRALPISIRADAEGALVLPRGYHVVANIPYYITGELLRYFLSATRKPASMTLLVQKEVAERIARAKKESLLSIAIKIYGAPKYLFTVPRGAFTPAPKVDSAVLQISSIHSPFENKGLESRFFEVLRAGFAHKRKLLARNLEAVAAKGHIQTAFTALSIPPKSRAEELSSKTWGELARAIPLPTNAQSHNK
jgi:16S rRNA (adenine1518-N6/adenine1519-N6)-dimethyltransferase